MQNIIRLNLLKTVICSGLLLGGFTLVFSGPELTDDPEKAASQSAEVTPWSSTRGQIEKPLAKTLAGQGNSKYLRASKHDGNLIETGFVNQGSLAGDYFPGSPSMYWPKGSGNSYGHTFVFYVGAEVIDANGKLTPIISDSYRRGDVEQSPDKTHWYHFRPLPKYFNNHHPSSADWDMGGISEDVGIDGIPNTGDEGENDGKLQTQEDFNSNGVLDLSMLNVVEYCAMSHRKETWPAWWPVGSFVGDDRAAEGPGVRDGRWNGAYGAYNRADQESYYVMDDHENDEFEYYPFEDAESRLPWPDGRRGLGITVEVRNYQWSAHLAEDIMISIYDITNYGKPLDKCVVGMFCDPDMGGTLQGDNASFDNQDDITYAWSEGDVSQTGIPLGYFGFAFLESPGLSNDGLDNDTDGIIDESQWNDIDEDGDWRAWQDENLNGIWDSEDANGNGRLDDGEDLNANGALDFEPLFDDIGSDGVGPDMEDYIGPDPDGTQANGRADQGEPNFGKTDNDESDQVGLTSFYLRDVVNVIQDDKTFWEIQIQPNTYTTLPGYTRDISWIYGSGFVPLPTGKTGTQRYAIALLFGVDQDDIFRNKRTMQEIYDHDYNFAKPPRKPLLHAYAANKKVILTWDDAAERSVDPIYGADFEAYLIYKSTDPNFSDIKTVTDAFGNAVLFKPLAIFDLKNGLKGVHPVSLGSEYGSESDLGVSYNMGSDSGLRHYFVDSSVTNGRTYYYAVVSLDRGYAEDFYERGLTTTPGLLTISPTECSALIQTDPIGRVVYADRNTAVVVPSEEPAGYLAPGLEQNQVIHASGVGTGGIEVNFINPYLAQTGSTYELSFQDDGTFEKLGPDYTGFTEKMVLSNITKNSFPIVITDQADLVYEGFKIGIENVTEIKIKSSGWTRGNSNLHPVLLDNYNGVFVPRDYEIRVLDLGADTSTTRFLLNFQIWDVTYPDQAFKLKCLFLEKSGTPTAERGLLTDGDVVLMVSAQNKRLWTLRFEADPTTTPINPVKGDVFSLVSTKPFDRNDVFRFTIVGNSINRTKLGQDLENIYTVPDPYIATSTLERRLISEEMGRGDRRIDFVNLPLECTISIFTSSGRLVRRIEHQSTVEEGRESWDLRTKDGLEVTHGVYLYVVEAPGIGKKIGKLSIIK